MSHQQKQILCLTRAMEILSSLQPKISIAQTSLAQFKSSLVISSYPSAVVVECCMVTTTSGFKSASYSLLTNILSKTCFSFSFFKRTHPQIWKTCVPNVANSLNLSCINNSSKDWQKNNSSARVR